MAVLPLAAEIPLLSTLNSFSKSEARNLGLKACIRPKEYLHWKNFRISKRKDKRIWQANRSRMEVAEGGYFHILKNVAEGRMSPGDAALLLESTLISNSREPQESNVDGFARIDNSRTERTGFPEVVWGPGKTAEQIAHIMKAMAERQAVVMATRITSDVHEKVEALLPGVVYHRFARILTYSCPDSESDNSADNNRYKQPILKGTVAILSAGTSDLPVAGRRE